MVNQDTYILVMVLIQMLETSWLDYKEEEEYLFEEQLPRCSPNHFFDTPCTCATLGFHYSRN